MTTDEYVPDEAEMREAYVWLSAGDNEGAREQATEDFNRGLARVRREAKAEALREAAGDIVWSAETLPHMTPHDAARGLVRRADRIETGDNDDRR